MLFDEMRREREKQLPMRVLQLLIGCKLRETEISGAIPKLNKSNRVQHGLLCNQHKSQTFVKL